jgi:hypothetical protein
MPGILPEWTFDMDEQVCACFIDWQKASGHVNEAKLMQILENTGI